MEQVMDIEPAEHAGFSPRRAEAVGMWLFLAALALARGQAGRVGTDENMLQGEDIYRRARDLLDEIRKRSGDQTRPTLELDYLKRLLDRF